MNLIKDIVLYGIALPLLLVAASIFDFVFYVARGILAGLRDAHLSTTEMYYDILAAYKDRWWK